MIFQRENAVSVVFVFFFLTIHFPLGEMHVSGTFVVSLSRHITYNASTFEQSPLYLFTVEHKNTKILTK